MRQLKEIELLLKKEMIPAGDMRFDAFLYFLNEALGFKRKDQERLERRDLWTQIKRVKEKSESLITKQINEALSERKSNEDKLKLVHDAYDYLVPKKYRVNGTDRFYTSDSVCRVMVDLVNPKAGESFFEPFCGNGMIVRNVIEREPNIVVQNRDIDSFALNTVDFLTHYAEELYGNPIARSTEYSNSFVYVEEEVRNDFIITNPPFSNLSDSLTTNFKGMTIKGKNPIPHAVAGCFNWVKKGGRVAILLPVSFLQSDKLKELRKTLVKHSTLKKVVLLSNMAFHPFTKVSTAILYFEDVTIENDGDYEYSHVDLTGTTNFEHAAHVSSFTIY